MAYVPRESELTKKAEEAWRKRFFGSMGDTEKRHGFGDVLATEVKFQQFGAKFKSMLEDGKSSNEIMQELMLDQIEYKIFEKKVGKYVLNSEGTRLFEDREYTDLKQFLDGHSGDLDIISWSTYYEVLKFFAKKELATTRHHKDASGLLMAPGCIETLMIHSFRKKYSKNVVNLVDSYGINPTKIVAQKSTRSSFGGFNVTFKNATFAEDSFSDIVKSETKVAKNTYKQFMGR